LQTKAGGRQHKAQLALDYAGRHGMIAVPRIQPETADVAEPPPARPVAA
jgi:hypothetical protein